MAGYYEETKAEGMALIEALMSHEVGLENFRLWVRNPALVAELAATLTGKEGSLRRVEESGDPMYPGITVEAPLDGYLPI